MPCQMCQQRGKTWEGSDPRCAFEDEVFDKNNWNCATSNAIRSIAEDSDLVIYNNDQNLASIPLSLGRFLIISWYKRRGRTEGMWVVDGTEIKLPDILLAESLVEMADVRELK